MDSFYTFEAYKNTQYVRKKIFFGLSLYREGRIHAGNRTNRNIYHTLWVRVRNVNGDDARHFEILWKIAVETSLWPMIHDIFRRIHGPKGTPSHSHPFKYRRKFDERTAHQTEPGDRLNYCFGYTVNNLRQRFDLKGNRKGIELGG